MNIREILTNGDTRICLFGETADVLPVAEKIKDRFSNITYLTVYGKEIRLQSLGKYGIPSVLYSIDTAKDHGYVIVCANYNFKKLTALLNCAGMKQYENYVSSRVLDAFMHEKKLFVSMGGELTEQLSNALAVCGDFTDAYSITVFPIREFWQDMREEYIHTSRLADLHIESASDNSKYKLFKLPRGILKEDCISIKLPDFDFRGMFPQMYCDSGVANPLLMRLYNRDNSIDYETVFAAKIDLFAEYLCENSDDYSDESVKKIAAMLMDDDLIGSGLIREHYKSESERWKKLEIMHGTDTALMDIFDSEIDSLCINRSVFEWSDCGVTKLLLYVLGKAGINGSVSEQDIHQRLEETSGTELPVYPCVRKALGLEERLLGKKYKVVNFNGVKYMDITEYTEYMVRYTLRSLELFRLTETDKKLARDWEDRANSLGGYYLKKKEVSCLEDWMKINSAVLP